MTAEAEGMAGRLTAFVAVEAGVPERDVRVTKLARLAGGASRELWSLDVELPGAAPGAGAPRRLALVLRRDPPGRVGESDRTLEAELLRRAGAAGVPVPRVYWACADPDVLGTPFFLMERVAGETLPRRLLRDERYAGARGGMLAELGAILARVHATDVVGLAGLERPAPGRAPAADQLAIAAATIRGLSPDPHPVLDLAERWLRERLPVGGPTTLVHGDFRIGNVMFDERGARAILDWELAHLGDPAEDLGWLCTKAWRYGSPLPAGGIGTREALLEAYEQAGGAAVGRERLRFWEALGSFKVAAVFVRQCHVHLSGAHPSLELASLGRRTAEAEEALVEILEERS